MNRLTAHQGQALDEYLELLNRYPELAKQRKHRRLILDRERLEEYAAQNKEALGVAASNPFIYVIVDLVESASPSGELRQCPYVRILNRKQLEGAVNTAVIATIEDPSLGPVGSIVFVAEERHATGLIERGIPRGFGEPQLAGPENALKELREETGYVGNHATLMGKALIDSGLGDSEVAFYHVPVIDRVAAIHEENEAIVDTSLVSMAEAWQQVLDGHLRDSFTIQALAFFEKRKRADRRPSARRKGETSS